MLVQTDKALAPNDANRFFKGFNFTRTASLAFDPASKNQIIEPLLVGLMNLDVATPANNLLTQPDDQEIADLLGAANTNVLEAYLDDPATADIDESQYKSLITTMTECLPDCNTTTRTEEIVKAVCAATLGSALMVIQ